MSEVHQCLHNELNYLGAIDGLLKNHIVQSPGGDDRLVSLGFQTSFDLLKSFPAVTCIPLQYDEVLSKAVETIKANKAALEDLLSLASDCPDSQMLFASLKHQTVSSVHLIARSGYIDVNVQARSVEVLSELPIVIAELGVIGLILASRLNARLQFLSFQSSVVWARKAMVDNAKALLETQITPPVVISVKSVGKLTAIKPTDISVTSWDSWKAA
jgi:hypothetical protein